MMEALGAYIKTITALTIFSALASMLMPDGNFRRYVELVLGVLVLTAVISPFLRLLGADGSALELHSLGRQLAQEEIVREYNEGMGNSAFYDLGE